MRNLKRLLTMVLAIAMMMSLMVVGAGATAFKDDKDITHKDAVEKMSSLNIINGKGEGNFDPTGMVTRAEMAKMICIALNGGNDPKLSSSSVVTSSFTDTKGHWAEGYVEYCVNLGIAAGLGNNTFGPDLQVTPSQAAKMLLVALGYDATYEKFTGATWALNSNKIAMQRAGLYDEIQGIDPNAPMTRDAAAQMIYNFCSAPMVKYEFGISGSGATVTGVKQAVDINLSTATAKPVYQTILIKCYRLITEEGTLVQMTYDKVKGEYGYVLYFGQDKDKNDIRGTYYSKTDYSKLFGMEVKLYFKDKENNNRYDRNDDPVYDIDAVDSKIMAEGYNGDFSDSKFKAKEELKFNGTVYDIDSTLSTVPVYSFVDGDYFADYSGNAFADADKTKRLMPWIDSKHTDKYDAAAVRLLDTNGNNKVDKIIYAPFNVEKVTYASSERATFGGQGNKDFKDITVYTGVAKDDVVTYTPAAYSINDNINVKKLDIKTGTISGTKGSGDDTEYQIDGSFYYNRSAASTGKVNFGLNDKINYVQFGGIIFWAKIVDYGVTSKDVGMVVNVATGATSTLDTDKIFAQLIFADGTKKNVRIIKENGTEITTANVGGVGDGKELDKVRALVGDMVTYKVDSDGYYELKSLDSDNLAGCDKLGTKSAYNNKQVGGYTLADNATVFFLKGALGSKTGNDAKVYTGKEIKNTLDSAKNMYIKDGVGKSSLSTEVSGFDYAKYAVLSNTEFPDITSKSNYAYLTADTVQTNTNNKSYLEFTIWTGVGEVPKEMPKVKFETTDSATNYKKGVVISYDTAGDGMIKNVKLVNLITDAVKGWEDKVTGDIQFLNTGVSKITSDTKIIFVDSDKTEAAVTAGIPLYDGTKMNCRYVVDGTGVNLLLIDNKNYMQANPVVTPYKIDTDIAKVQKELNEGRSVEFTAGTVIGTGSLTVKDNTTLTLAEAPENTTTIKVEKGGKLIVKDATWAPAAENDITVDAGGILETKGLNMATHSADLVVNGTLTVNGDLTTSTVATIDGEVTVTGVANLTAAAVNGVGTLNIGSFGGTIATSITNAKVKNVNVTGTAKTTLGAAANVTAQNMTFAGELVVDNLKTITVGAGTTLTLNGTVTGADYILATDTTSYLVIRDGAAVTGATLANFKDKAGAAAADAAAIDGHSYKATAPGCKWQASN